MTAPKGKQRSIHMDDETFDILERLAAQYKANNSTIVRMALIQFDRGSAPRPASVIDRVVAEVPATAAAIRGAPTDGVGGFHPAENERREIALPDPKVSSFSVSGGKVRGRVPRNEREDDGLDV